MFDPKKLDGRVAWSESLEPIETDHLYRYRVVPEPGDDEAHAMRLIFDDCAKVGAEPKAIFEKDGIYLCVARFPKPYQEMPAFQEQEVAHG